MPNGQVSESDDPVIHALQRALQAAEIRFVRILWCDNANVIRGKAVHVAALESLRHGVGITVAQQALPVMYDAVAPGSGLEPVGEVLLAPDWSTFTVLPYVPNHAQVLADMMLDDAPWEHCPRDFLKQQVARLADHRLSLQVAFENEFTLLRRDADSLVPVETSIYATTLAMNESAEVVTAIADALLAQGLEPVRYPPRVRPRGSRSCRCVPQALWRPPTGSFSFARRFAGSPPGTVSPLCSCPRSSRTPPATAAIST